MRLAIVDTLTTIAFFTVAAALTELLIVGLSPAQVLVTRLLTVPVMVATGRPYGIWRDFVFRKVMPRGAVARTGLDVVTFLSFQVPVYGATLVIAGARGPEIAMALGSATAFMILLSRPFGLLLDAMRRWTGCTPIGPA